MPKNRNKSSKRGKGRFDERILAEGPSGLAEAAEEGSNGQLFHFFWRSGSPFSQWHSSRYELDGVQYSCAEQGMMHGKALLFGDEDMARAILDTDSPREMKKLGRLVRGYKDSAWKRNREEIVYRNSVAKFTQNEGLREALLATTGTLVEASPSDTIWGIGLHENDARRTPPARWNGLNLLGKILTRVRDEMREGVEEMVIDE